LASNEDHELRLRAGIALKDAQWMQSKLDHLLETADAEAFRKAPTAYEEAREEAADVLKENQRLSEHGSALVELADKCGTAEEAGRVATIDNSFRDALRDWRFKRDAERDEVVERARRVRTALDSAVAEAAWLTVPSDVESALRRLRVGRPLNFAKRFGKVLPKPEQQKDLLEELQGRPNELSGVVDIASGTIYRVSSRGWMRGVTAGIPLLLVMAVAGLVVLYDWLANGTSGFRDLTVARTSLLATFGSFVAGAIVHLTVERAKSLKVFGTPRVYVPGDAVMWLHLRWASISLSLVPILAVWIALHWTGQKNLLLYFFAGYSVDSLSGLVFTRLGAAAATRESSISKLFRDGNHPNADEAAG
jgi:hypothetical protein